MQFLQKEIQIVLLDISRRYCLFSDKSHYENYVLPAGWQYATMGEICSKIVDGDHNPPPGQPNPTKFVMVSSKNIANDKICNITDVRYLTEQDFYCAHKRTYVEKGDILFTSVASLGRTCIYSLEEPVTFQRSVTVINTLIYNKYLKLFLDSPIYQNYVNDNARGTAQKGFYINQISDSLVPIPPLSEQIRLATKVEELLNTVCQLELLKDDLGNNIKKIKSTILDMAIIGRLIPQNPSDEPAIQLIRTINPDFRSTDNRHYENVPTGWQFVKIKDVFTINPKNKVDDDIDAGFVSMAMIDDGYRDSYQFEKKKWALIKNGFTHFKDGDIAVAKISPCLENRKSMILKNLPNGIGAGTTELHIFRSAIVDPKFALYFFKSDHFINQCVGTFNGVVGQQRVGKNIIEDIMFPLPPYKEQRRISERITQIFMYLDKITAEL